MTLSKVFADPKAFVAKWKDLKAAVTAAEAAEAKLAESEAKLATQRTEADAYVAKARAEIKMEHARLTKVRLAAAGGGTACRTLPPHRRA
jgi:hypothetical protein